MESALIGLLGFSGVIIAALVAALYRKRNNNPGYDEIGRSLTRLESEIHSLRQDLLSRMEHVHTEMVALKILLQERLPPR